MRRNAAWCVALGLGAAVSCLAVRAAGPGSTFEQLQRQWDVPGAAAVVARDGTPVMVSAGSRELGGAAPVTPQTAFLIGSLSKTLTALAAASLAVQGRVRLDEPLRERLPDLRMPSDALTEQVSLRDLLAQRSGLAWAADYPFYCDDSGSLDDLGRKLKHVTPPTSTLRQRWQYSNLNYGVAGYALAHVLGVPFTEVVTREVLAPVGMAGAGFGRQGFLAREHATGYEPVAGALRQVRLPGSGIIEPSGGAYASAADLGALLVALTRPGHTLSERALSLVATPQVAASNDRRLYPRPEFGTWSYGLGAFVSTYRGHRLVTHSGQREGFRSHFAWLPDQRLAVAVLANVGSRFFAEAAAYALIDAALGVDDGRLAAHLLQQQRDADRAADARAAHGKAGRPSSEYIGSYQHAAYGTVEIRGVGRGLSFELGECRSEMTPRRADAFSIDIYLPPEPLPVRFESDRDGMISALLVGFDPDAPVRFERRPP